MNLDDFITGSLEPEGAGPEAEVLLAASGEARALAPELAGQRELLASADVWDEPPAGLEDAIVAAIADEAGPGSAPTAGTPPAERRRRSRWLTAVPAAAVAAVLAVVLVTSTGGGGDDAVTVELAATDLAPEAVGEVAVHDTPSGARFELDADGLPPSGPGEYYEAWVVGPGGLVAIGTFHARQDGATVILWSGVELAQVQAFAITIEDDDGDVTTSGKRVLEGELGGS